MAATGVRIFDTLKRSRAPVVRTERTTLEPMQELLSGDEPRESTRNR